MIKIKNVLLLGTLLVLSACASVDDGKKRRSAKEREQAQLRSTIINAGHSQVGARYLFGGNAPKQGFDCSGLVEYSYAKAGISVPRTTRSQAQFFKTTDNPKVGDLVFFKINGRTVSHVGIYLGDNKMLHAPSSGKRVEVTRIDQPYWRERFYKFGTIQG